MIDSQRFRVSCATFALKFLREEQRILFNCGQPKKKYGIISLIIDKCALSLVYLGFSLVLNAYGLYVYYYPLFF